MPWDLRIPGRALNPKFGSSNLAQLESDNGLERRIHNPEVRNDGAIAPPLEHLYGRQGGRESNTVLTSDQKRQLERAELERWIVAG